MALQTRTIVSFDNNQCVWSFEFDDVALVITRLVCVNNGPHSTRGRMTVLANGRTFTRLVAPGGSLDQAVPTQQATKLDITVDARGRVDGIDWTFQYGPEVV